MNRSYKVVWNRSLGCFTAVAEYAKARGKSSNSSVSSNSVASEAINSSTKLLRLTAICAGIAASGFSMQVMAVDGNFDNVTANGDVTATGNVTGTNITASGMVDANGGLTVSGGQTVDMGGNKVANGTVATDAVNFGQLEAVKTTANQGFNIQANNGAEEQIGPGETVTFQDGDSNIKITRTGNTISIATSANQSFATVTTTGNATVGGMLNVNGGLTVAGGQTVDMGGNKVTNVANGTAVTDAVNFGQLEAIKTTANQGWNIQANSGTPQKIAPGDTVTFTNGNNVVISRNGNTISVATSLNPNFTTVTTTGNVTVGGTLNANGGLTVASNKTVNMGGNKVTNVANGTIAENGKDAATTGQLWRLTEGGDGVKYFHTNSVEADSEAIGQESVAIGPKTKAEGASSLAAGDSASVTAQGEGAIALGQNATAGGGAPGSGGAGAVAVGRNSAAAGSSATALGDGARAGGGSATALGNSAQASGGNATALGKSANASGAGAIALGQANARGNDSFAAGNGAETNTRDSIALGRAAGVGTRAEINDSGQRHSFIAIGERSGQNMDGNNAIAIGVGSGSNSKQSNQIAIGTEAGTYLEGERNVSIGFEANKKAVNTEVRHATAIGGLSVADTDAVAVGYGAKAATQSVALGSGAIAKSGSVALGHSSKAVEVTGTSYLTAKAFTGESVSVGNADTSFTRRITNVEDGAADNDAVNVNQLKALKDSLGSFTPEAGGNANYNVDGTLSVAAAKVDGQAVNLGQLNQAVASSKTKFYSVNPVGDSANEDGSGALGANSANSMAIGHAARIDSSQRATAVGYSVIVRADDGTAIGSGSTVDDAAGVAIGKGAYSRGNNSLAMGTDAQTEPKNSNNTLENAIAIGTSSRATDNSASALGHRAAASGLRSSAMGYFAQAKNTDSMAFGSQSIATGVSAQASGTSANASGTNAQARGTSANASGMNAQASGTNASASGFNALAQGTRAKGYATDGIAMGTDATSGFEDPTNQDPNRNTAGIAIGKSSLADQKHALALGVEAKARAQSATAVGDGANASGINALAIGTGAAANKQDATAIGSNAAASAQDATAFGRGAAASAQDAIAFGREAQAVARGAMALGQGAKANTNANDVALGAGSITGAVVNTPNATVDKNTYTYAGTNATSTVSVGAVGKERTITNVAAGRVSATSTDAINGSQLHGTNQAVTALGSNLDTAGQSVATALGGTSAYDPTTHQINASLNVNGNTYTTVESAIKYAAQGWNVQTNGDTASNVAPGSTVQFKDGKNIKITRNGKDITVATADDVTFTKVTSGSMTVNNTDSIAKGGTKNYVTQGSASVVNGGDVYTAINTTNQQYQGDNGAVVTRNPNQVLKVKGGATTGTENNIQTVSNATDGSISVKLAEKIDLGIDGRVKIGSTTINNTGMTIAGGPSVTAAGINAGDKVITGVANGSVAAGSKEAVNGSQLHATNQNVTKNAGDITTLQGGFTLNSNGANGAAIKAGDTVDIGTANGETNLTVTKSGNTIDFALNKNLDLGASGSVTTGATTVNDNGIIITKAAGAPAGITNVSLTNTGLDNGGNKIVNVAAGVNGTDAVNVNQLDAVNTTANKGWDVKVNGIASDNVAPGETVQFVDGKNIKVTRDNDQVIKVATSDEVEFTKVTLGDATNNTILTSNANGLDVGGDKITNVAAGTIGSGSTDAVNGGQLFGTAQSVATSLGGNSTVNADGTVNAPSYELDNGSNTGTKVAVNNVGAALGNLDDRTTSNTTEINKGIKFGNGTTNNQFALGDTINVKGDSNLTSTTTTDGVQVSLNKNLDLGASGSVTTGATTVNDNGIIITKAAGAPAGITNVSLTNTGLDNGGNKIVNVAAGVNGTDAVNVNQLDAVNTTANKGWDVKVNGIASDNVAPGETVQFVDGKNIKVTRDNDQVIKVATSDEVEFTKVTLGDATNNTILTSNANGLDVGGDKITNVAAGTIGSGSTDAVNGGQISNVLGGSVNNSTGDFTANTPSANGGIGNTGENNFNDAIGAVNATVNAGWNVSANGTTGENVAPGAKVDFSNTDDNIVIAQTGTDLKFNLKKDLKVDSVTTVNSKLDDSGLSINDGTGNLTTITNDGLTIAGGPSITKTGIDAGNNKIVNVTAGTEDDDAVNFGQLSQVSGNVNKGLNFTGDDTTTIINRQLGDTLNIRGGATGALTNGNIGVVANGNQLEVKMAENINLGSDGSVTTGDTVVNNDGLTIAGGPSVTKDGIDAGGSQITNVGSGLGGKDLADITGDGLNHAVNVGDLKDTIGYINKDIAASKTEVTEGKNITVTETTGADGQTRYEVATKDDLVADSVTAGDEAGGTKLDKGGVTITGGPNKDVILDNDGLDNGGNKITNVADGAINAGSTDAINGGQLHNLGSDVAGIIGGDATYDADGNLTANNIGGTGKGNISDAIASINQGNAQANEDIKVNTDNIQANTDRLDAGLSFGADNGDNINKPVGDGTALKFEGSDNITTTTTGSGIKFDLNGNISVDSVTTGNTTVNTNGVTIKDGPSITTEGINAGNKTITGVADGIKVNDAVNLGQLNALDGKLSNSVNELGYKINEVEDDANAGISAAMAMSSLPQAYIPGKSMVGGGIATYNGQSAVAIGVSKVSDNGRWVIKVNGTADTQGNAGGAVGAGFHF